MIKLWHSTSMRIALGYAALVILAGLGLSGIIWWRTTAYLDREIDAVIVSDAQAVGDGLRDFGLIGAINTINSRIKATADEHAVYLLADPLLSPQAGNIDAWPLQLGQKSGWYEIPLVRDGKLHATRVLHVVLPDGFHLLVGRDVQDRVAIRSLVINALIWTTIAAILLAIAGGVLVRNIVLKRVATINETTNAIVHGDLARRMPAPHSSDEFDQLIRTINGMLDQIQLLVEGARNTSDAIAHDLRTPLAELRSRLESIIRDRLSPEGTTEAVGDAVEAVDNLIEIFNALLRLADIKSGTRRAAFKAVDLSQVVHDVCELFAPLLEEKKVGLSVDAASGITVEGDPHLLAQALTNLLDNAIKFAPHGGKIVVSLTKRDDGNIELAVRDNGPGIPAHERERVTKQFQRGEGTTGTPGVGLGLSLVEAVANLHHGMLLLADNAPGLAASLVLPAASPS